MMRAIILPEKVNRLFQKSIMLFYFGIGFIYAIVWLVAYKNDMLWRADFTAFYTGWTIVREGKGASLYDLNLQAQYQQALLQGRSFYDGVLPFINPPHIALLLSPFAWLPRTTAYFIWSLIQAALLIWLLLLIRRLSALWDLSERRLLFSAVIAFPPPNGYFPIGYFLLIFADIDIRVIFSVEERQASRCRYLVCCWFN